MERLLETSIVELIGKYVEAPVVVAIAGIFLSWVLPCIVRNTPLLVYVSLSKETASTLTITIVVGTISEYTSKDNFFAFLIFP